MIKLKKMDNSNIIEMCRIADDVFHYVEEKPSTFFLNVHNDALSEIKDASPGIADWVEYFAITVGDKIIGTIGLYHLSNEPLDTLWVGWFCVDLSYRISGYGSKAMEALKDIAKLKNAKVLKLYTSSHSEERAAQFFYAKVGFKTYLEVPKDDLVYIYKELLL